MKPSLRAATLTLLALTFAAAAHAAPAVYTIDPSHSEVGFKVRHFFAKVPGHFNSFAGSITYDDQNLTASSVDVTIQTASINTNNERRDKHLRSEDFFRAEKDSTITFKSTKIVPGADATHFKIEGDLNMRGVSKPITLDAELIGVGAVGIGGNAMGTRAGFQATTTVNRKDWGVSWNKVLDNGGTMLDDNVAIELDIEAMRGQPAMAPKAPAKPAGASSANTSGK
jgi:polyisoprenoid-binding protein YceI